MMEDAHGLVSFRLAGILTQNRGIQTAMAEAVEDVPDHDRLPLSGSVTTELPVTGVDFELREIHSLGLRAAALTVPP